MFHVKYYIILFFVISATAKKVLFFRKDYTYFSALNGFFKLHYQGNVGTDFDGAFRACSEESSQLYYPKTAEEIAEVKSLYTGAVNLTDSEILVGIYDPYDIGEFITVDGSSTPIPINVDEEQIDPEKRCIILNLETGEYTKDYCTVKFNRAFICRKYDEVEPCPTIDKGYIYKASLNKCYKFHSHDSTWTAAFTTCYMEGARLLVLDKELEYQLITSWIAERTDKAYWLGFKRNENPGDFFTVDGIRLTDESYQVWYDKPRDSQEACGVLYRKYFQTQPCDVINAFICEMRAF